MTGDPTEFARELRQRQTRAEEALWKPCAVDVSTD